MKHQNQPKKHHFIPEFYQKGFQAEDGTLYVYNKIFGGIKSRNPAQILYEEHLHTIRIGGESTNIIEQYYSKIEGEFSKCTEFLKNNIQNPCILTELKSNQDFIRAAKIIIATQFWRTPCNRRRAIELSSKLLNLYDCACSETKDLLGLERGFVKFISRHATKDDSLKVAQFILLPILTFKTSEETQKIKLYKTPSDTYLFTSDRPVIYDDINALFSFESVIFPISKELAFYATIDSQNKLDAAKINSLLAARANKIVISASRQKLENIKLNQESPSTAKENNT